MADNLPNWNLNIIECWHAYYSTRKQKYKEKDDVWPEHSFEMSSWGSEIKEERKLDNIPPEEVNVYLSEFIIAARTKKGEQYEPSSLRGTLRSVDCYLARCEYGERLFIDPEFMRLRDKTKAKQKELKKTRRSLVKYFLALKEKFCICNMLYIHVS